MGKKELLTSMYDMMVSLIETVDMLYAGFIADNAAMIEKAALSLEPIDHAADAASSAIVREARSDASLEPYVSVPAHIKRMRDNVLRIGQCTYRRIKEDILFSDRAISELEYLFERERDIMVHTRDMILARNTLVGRHLAAADDALVRTANAYATHHEERLIEGLCLPKASALFLEELDAFKEIASHANAIGRELSRK